MTTNDIIRQAIYSAIDELNQQQPTERQLQKSIDTTIMDQSGKLDSLGLVNFIVATEEKVGEALGSTIILTDEKAFSQESSPFKTVGTLTNYISQLLEENSHGS